MGERLPSLADDPSFILSREALQRGERLSIGRVLLHPVTNEWVIPLRHGIRGSNDALRFVLVIGLPVSKTYSFWKDAPLPPGAAMGLVRDDLYLASRYPLPAGAEIKDLFLRAQTGALAQHLQRCARRSESVLNQPV